MGEKSERWAWEQLGKEQARNRSLQDKLFRARCAIAYQRHRAEVWKRRALERKVKR